MKIRSKNDPVLFKPGKALNQMFYPKQNSSGIDHATLMKITALWHGSNRRKTKNGIRVDGPYWFGYWMDNGKRRSVYFGKHLPEELLPLLKGRYKRPGYKNYTWPGRAQAA